MGFRLFSAVIDNEGEDLISLRQRVEALENLVESLSYDIVHHEDLNIHDAIDNDHGFTFYQPRGVLQWGDPTSSTEFTASGTNIHTIPRVWTTKALHAAIQSYTQ